jgi:hypothetical protein
MGHYYPDHLRRISASQVFSCNKYRLPTIKCPLQADPKVGGGKDETRRPAGSAPWSEVQRGARRPYGRQSPSAASGAVLGAFMERQPSCSITNHEPILTTFYTLPGCRWSSYLLAPASNRKFNFLPNPIIVLFPESEL